jgi:hypothetical protein
MGTPGFNAPHRSVFSSATNPAETGNAQAHERFAGGCDIPTGDVETYYEDGIWKNRIEGSSPAVNTAPTKAEAEDKGRAMAQIRHVEHIIKDKTGRIAQRNTYPRSRDPRSSRG